MRQQVTVLATISEEWIYAVCLILGYRVFLNPVQFTTATVNLRGMVNTDNEFVYNDVDHRTLVVNAFLTYRNISTPIQVCWYWDVCPQYFLTIVETKHLQRVVPLNCVRRSMNLPRANTNVLITYMEGDTIFIIFCLRWNVVSNCQSLYHLPYHSSSLCTRRKARGSWISVG